MPVLRPRSIHLHDEQFDGHLHAACRRVPPDPPGAEHPRIVDEEAFGRIPVGKRCHFCSNIHWPYGGAPLNIEGMRNAA